MPQLSPCPTRGQLLALNRGELEDNQLEAVCEHLSHCSSCEEALASIDEDVDSVVANLRRFADHEPFIRTEEMAVLEARAAAIPFQGLLGHESPVTRLGKYELLEELGRGGMGVVYAALHTGLNRKVAVKVMATEFCHDSNMRTRFQREVLAAGALVHPNIVLATDADEQEGRLFLVMELVEGLDLEKLVRLNGALPVAEACEIIRQAALGLQYVHEKKRVHRDLKPSNLMVTKDGVVKILDLGLTRLFDEDGTSRELTRTNAPVGTADYMAPEQWENSRTADIRADIYSLGCTLYKLLTGKPPYSGPEYNARAKKHVGHAVMPLPTIQSQRPDVPGGLAKVLERMLEKEPRKRFETPRQLAEALNQFSTGGDCAGIVVKHVRREAVHDIASPSGATVTDRGETAPVAAFVGTSAKTVERMRYRWPFAMAGAALAATIVFAVWLDSNWRPVPVPPPPSNGNAIPQAPPEPVELVPGMNRLLTKERPPELRYWTNYKGKPKWEFSRQNEDLWVDAPSTALCRLGETKQHDYKIQVYITQHQWHGGVGVYFGFHHVVIANKPYVRFQYVMLERSGKPNAPMPLIMTRYIVTDQVDGNVLKPVEDHRGIGPYLPMPENNDSCLLELNMNRVRGLYAVKWQGETLKQLSKDPAALTPDDYVGEFGVISSESTCVFSDASVFLFDGGKP